MATILDVAKLAGVSQGTVSNVLNKKGNVSVEKIRAVEKAAKELGFTINERAKMLRSGKANIISVILPNLEFKQYRDFYRSVKLYAEKNNYTANVLISGDNPGTELELIQKSKSDMAEGIITFTCLNTKENMYKSAGFKKVCFIERKPRFDADYYGFDYNKAGKDIASVILEMGYKNVILVTQSDEFSNEKEFKKAFSEVLENKNYEFLSISTDEIVISNRLLNIFTSEDKIDAIVTTNIGIAEKIREIKNSMFIKEDIEIFTLSPIYSLPENDYNKYELNYSLIGQKVAEKIIKTNEKKYIKNNNIYENDGQRKWGNITVHDDKKAECLNILTIESPESTVMKALSNIYTEKTGIKVNIAVYSYDEIFEQLTNSDKLSLFDVFRIDVRWLSWFAEKILMPLDEIDTNISQVFKEYIPSLESKYSVVNERIYSLPLTPSAQLLFYRKDLFENIEIRRMYKETYKDELRVPNTFKEFNQIARFFTEISNISYKNKVKYGTNLVVGNTGVAATEFLARYFSYKKNLYDENCDIKINNKIGIDAMNDLVETFKYSRSQQLHWWTTSAREFANGDVAMSIMFSNYASEILGRQSKIIGKVGVSMVPGNNPILGGGALAVSKNTKNPKDALAFVKWMTTEPIASARAALGGVSPCLKTYEKYDIINTFPWLELSKECYFISNTNILPNGKKEPFNDRKFLNVLGTAVKNILMGLMSIEEALDYAQNIIDNEF